MSCASNIKIMKPLLANSWRKQEYEVRVDLEPGENMIGIKLLMAYVRGASKAEAS